MKDQECSDGMKTMWGSEDDAIYAKMTGQSPNLFFVFLILRIIFCEKQLEKKG